MTGRAVISILLGLCILLACCRGGWPRRQPRDAALHQIQALGLDYNQKAFIKAAANGDIETVSLYLDAGMDPNGEDDERSTALGAATTKERLNMIRFLVARGADPNRPAGWPPLCVVTATADVPVVKTLLDCGANPNAVNFVGDPIVWYAVWPEVLPGPAKEEITEQYVGCLRVLLERGADVNARDVDGETLLIHAAKESGPEAVALLIEKGANLAAVDSEGKTAKQRANERGDKEIVALLEKAGG